MEIVENIFFLIVKVLHGADSKNHHRILTSLVNRKNNFYLTPNGYHHMDIKIL